jgi:uncharacterized membrane protein
MLLACAAADVDTASATICDGAPTVRWANFGAAFMLHECQPCHGSLVTDRAGAPPDVHFDTADDVWRQASRVLARAASDPPSMPPAGGISEEDQASLKLWLLCAPVGY